MMMVNMVHVLVVGLQNIGVGWKKTRRRSGVDRRRKQCYPMGLCTQLGGMDRRRIG